MIQIIEEQIRMRLELVSNPKTDFERGYLHALEGVIALIEDIRKESQSDTDYYLDDFVRYMFKRVEEIGDPYRGVKRCLIDYEEYLRDKILNNVVAAVKKC